MFSHVLEMLLDCELLCSAFPECGYCHILCESIPIQPLPTSTAQLHIGQIGLNQWLFHIRRSETPSCLHCQGIMVETV